MKSWRGVLVSVLSGWAVGCGAELEAEGVEPALASQVAEARQDGTESSESLLEYGWDVCTDDARRLRDIRPGPASSGPASLVEHPLGWLLFTAEDPEAGRELWVSTGREQSTVRVKDIRPGPVGSAPRDLTPLDRWVLFAAEDEAHGPELWRTDGTERGTELVRDLLPGKPGSAPEHLTVVGTDVYFTAQDTEGRKLLWRTDGTAKGTERVRDFERATAGALIEALVAWEDQLAVVTYRDSAGTELWLVDRKGRTRRLVAPGSARVLKPTPVGRQLFFLVDPGTEEADLWVTRDVPGTAARLRHFPGAQPMDLTALGEDLYFVAGGEGFFGQPGDLEHGSELWTSDGTVMGTRLVRDIHPGSTGAFHNEDTSWMVAVGHTLYFAADDGRGAGRELWRSDGTARGTALVIDLPGNSDPRELAGYNGTLFFSASTPGRGREAWYTHGRFWNTRTLTDIAPGAQDAFPNGFFRAGWQVYFRATDGQLGEELWTVPFRPFPFCGFN